jgi:hypothetical protein
LPPIVVLADIDRIIRSYLRSDYDAIWWFVRPGVVERISGLVRDAKASKPIEIHPWEGWRSDRRAFGEALPDCVSVTTHQHLRRRASRAYAKQLSNLTPVARMASSRWVGGKDPDPN